MRATPRDTLIVVPTLVHPHRWYAELKTNFADIDVGLLGGGSNDRTPILIATYDSAAIHAEALGNRYGLLVFDECHHLPSGFYKSIVGIVTLTCLKQLRHSLFTQPTALPLHSCRQLSHVTLGREPLAHDETVVGCFEQMAGRTEERIEGLEDGQKVLSVTGRLEALQHPSSSSRSLM